jgi:hypothetical protein
LRAERAREIEQINEVTDMARRPKEWSELGFLPLRQHWQMVNRLERSKDKHLRAQRKTRDQKRRRCTCGAYKFPHRPGGGSCRHPDPPAKHWRDQPAAEIAERVAKFRERWGEPTPEQMTDLINLTTKPYRPYRGRYAGILRQIARNNGLHPIRDRKLIEWLLPRVISQAKQIKRQWPRAKYRNMETSEAAPQRVVVRGVWASAGPTM